jgi:hypothetical protein
MIVETLLDALQNILVLPKSDTALLARAGSVLDDAGPAVIAVVRHLMRDDQVVLGSEGTLHVVTGDAGLLARCRHGAAVRVG